jgi:hypothetical protein
MHRNEKDILRFISTELVVGAILIGMIILGALVYAKAVKFQRFIEPMLAVLQPRDEFTVRFNSLIREEFGHKESNPDVQLQGSVLGVRKAFLTSESPHGKGVSNLDRLGRIFLKLLEDPWMRANTNFIMVSLEVPFSFNQIENHNLRNATADEAELVLLALLNTNQKLKNIFAPLFTSAAISVPPINVPGEWVTFHIMPSEGLHAEVLKRFEKYAP